MSALRSTPLLVTLALAACSARAPGVGARVEGAASPAGSGELRVRASPEDPSPEDQRGEGPAGLDWSSEDVELVFCRYFPEPERGDYLWIRLAEDRRDDGDAGARLDIDLCRLERGGSGGYAPMRPGEHGSHCAPEPGFAIWWHRGEAAYNSQAPARCELVVEREGDALSGRFECGPLDPADAKTKPEAGGAGQGAVSVAGRFSCTLEYAPPPA